MPAARLTLLSPATCVFSSTTRPLAQSRCPSQLQQVQQVRNASILSSLSDNAGAYNKRIRRGRGPASGKGKTSGRGMNGQKQHGKTPYRQNLGRHFNGGQTPEEVVHGKRGFDNQYVKRATFASIHSISCSTIMLTNTHQILHRTHPPQPRHPPTLPLHLPPSRLLTHFPSHNPRTPCLPLPPRHQRWRQASRTQPHSHTPIPTHPHHRLARLRRRHQSNRGRRWQCDDKILHKSSHKPRYQG